MSYGKFLIYWVGACKYKFYNMKPINDVMPSVFEIGLLAGMVVKILKIDLELVEYETICHDTES